MRLTHLNAADAEQHRYSTSACVPLYDHAAAEMVLALLPMQGIHPHPGPRSKAKARRCRQTNEENGQHADRFTFISANVRGLCPHWATVVQWPYHAMLIQEADVTPADAGNIVNDFKDAKDEEGGPAGWNMRFGTMPPGSDRGPNTRVCAAVRAPAPCLGPSHR